MKLKIGDEVRTRKGCRIQGAPGKLTITEIGRKWNQFDAVMCEYYMKNSSEYRAGAVRCQGLVNYVYYIMISLSCGKTW